MADDAVSLGQAGRGRIMELRLKALDAAMAIGGYLPMASINADNFLPLARQIEAYLREPVPVRELEPEELAIHEDPAGYLVDQLVNGMPDVERHAMSLGYDLGSPGRVPDIEGDGKITPGPFASWPIDEGLGT